MPDDDRKAIEKDNEQNDLSASHDALTGAYQLFAIGQAFSAYGRSFLLVPSGEDYALLFASGSCALVLALVLVSSWTQSAAAHSTRG